jgi:hypothetical protein
VGERQRQVDAVASVVVHGGCDGDERRWWSLHEFRRRRWLEFRELVWLFALGAAADSV